MKVGKDLSRVTASPGIVVRAVATAAAWSIAVVVAMRLRHPMVALAAGALAVCVTVLIWLPSSSNKGGN